MKIKLATENRKEAAARLAEITGTEFRYTRVPRCAYEVGPYIIERDGSFTVAEGTELSPLRTMVAEGLIKPFEAPITADTAQEQTPVSLTVRVPMKNHTGVTLRNLINQIYTRADLINKALGTHFRVEEALVEALKKEECVRTVESLLQVVVTYEEEHGRGIESLIFTPEEITFSGLLETEDPAVLRTFTTLCRMMNKQAVIQKRIQAKAVKDENEKYALRTWLTRLGMNGPNYKEARAVLMRSLNGHASFRTEAEKEKWQSRHVKKRASLDTTEVIGEEVKA